MGKTIPVFILMVIVGAATLFGTAILLGKPKTNYEFVLHTRLAWCAAILAFVATGAVAWYLDKRGKVNSRRDECKH